MTTTNLLLTIIIIPIVVELLSIKKSYLCVDVFYHIYFLHRGDYFFIENPLEITEIYIHQINENQINI